MNAARPRFLKACVVLAVAAALCGCSIGVVITNSPDIPGNSPPRPY